MLGQFALLLPNELSEPLDLPLRLVDLSDDNRISSDHFLDISAVVEPASLDCDAVNDLVFGDRRTIFGVE